jgi:hypothetical protein
LVGVLWDAPLQSVDEVLVAYGFGDVVVHAGVDASLAITVHCVGGHGDHWCVSGVLLGAS